MDDLLRKENYEGNFPGYYSEYKLFILSKYNSSTQFKAKYMENLASTYYTKL